MELFSTYDDPTHLILMMCLKERSNHLHNEMKADRKIVSEQTLQVDL